MQLEDGITYCSCALGQHIEVPQSLTTAVVVAIYHRKFSRAYHDDLRGDGVYLVETGRIICALQAKRRLGEIC